MVIIYFYYIFFNKPLSKDIIYYDNRQLRLAILLESVPSNMKRSELVELEENARLCKSSPYTLI
jgi:hypothetical protein